MWIETCPRVAVWCCLLLPSAAAAQIVSESEASVFVGCYDVEVGPWSVEVVPEVESHVPVWLELRGPAVVSGPTQGGGHVRIQARVGGPAAVRTAAGESRGSWSWATTNAKSVRITPPPAWTFAIVAILRDGARLEGRAVPTHARLADTRREGFPWAPVTLARVECDEGAASR